MSNEIIKDSPTPAALLPRAKAGAHQRLRDAVVADPGEWYRIEKRSATAANVLYNDIDRGRKIWEGISGLEVARDDVYVWVRTSDPSASTPEGVFPEVDDESDDGGLTLPLDIPEMEIPEQED